MDSNLVGFLRQNGPIGNGAGPKAVSLAQCEAKVDWIHPAEAYDEKYEHRYQPDSGPFQQSEGGNGDKYQNDDLVSGPGQSLAVAQESFAEHAESSEVQETSDDHDGTSSSVRLPANNALPMKMAANNPV